MEKKLDTAKYLKRIIVVSWVSLFLCSFITLFGGDVFEIVSTNENFMAMCNFVDKHIWATYLLSAIYCFISLYFFVLAILQKIKYKKWQLIVVIFTVLIGTAIKLYNANVGLIFDIWQMVIMPCVFIGKNYKSYYKVLIANALLFVFQAISMFTKNSSFLQIYNENAIGAIFAIDIILMEILYYAYSNLKFKKEGNEK